MVTRQDIDKLSKPRKINVGHDPAPFQQNWISLVREAEAVAQAPMVAIPIQQVETYFTFAQPATT